MLPVVSGRTRRARLAAAHGPQSTKEPSALVEMDILRPQGQQRRNRAFHAHEVMSLLYAGIDAVLDDVATLRNYRVTNGT
jgi:hypothetical protein